MSFISFKFVFFLLLVVFAYFIVPKSKQWVCLLIASYLFYMSGGIQSVLFILLTTITVFFAGIRLEKQQVLLSEKLKSIKDAAEKKEEKALCQKRKRRILTAAIAFNIGLLVLLKYAQLPINSFFSSVTGSEKDILDIIVPLGISFYTLQSIGYLMELYRGKTKAEHNLARFALFISFFPQIMQGPISKYQDLTKTLYGPHDFDYQRVRSGVLRIMWGYFKKLIIAERTGLVFRSIIEFYDINGLTGPVLFFAFIVYGFQIYSDFAGGMDITLGISEIFGIQVVENFNRPYFSRNVAEFWQRWHMTLGAWMRNYVFYPLALSKPFNAFGKKIRGVFGSHAAKIIPTSIASFIVFLLVGIWHGTGYKYVAYGLYNAFFVSTATLLEPMYEKARKFFRVPESSFIWYLFQMGRTLLLVTIGRYFSSSTSFMKALRLLKSTFFIDDTAFAYTTWPQVMQLGKLDAACITLAVLLMFAVDIFNERGVCVREKLVKKALPIRWAVYIACILCLAVFGKYGVGFDSGAFIYQGF